MRDFVGPAKPMLKHVATAGKSTRLSNVMSWVKRRKATAGLDNLIVVKFAIVSWIAESTIARSLAIPRMMTSLIALGHPN
jgi:hypothetical protein